MQKCQLRIKDNFGQAMLKAGGHSVFLSEVSNLFHISVLKFADEH